MARANAIVPEPTSRFGTKRLYRDAGSMASSSVANAVLGIGFWAIAAKIFPPAQLGVMTAVLAVIVSVGMVIAAGVGDAYAALFPAAGDDRRRFYRIGQRTFLALALVSGVVAAVCTTRWLQAVHGSVGVGILVAVGILVWSRLALQNATLVALGRASWLPAASIAVSVIKIVLLPILAVTIAWHAVELSFALSAIVVVLILRPMVARVIDTGHELPAATIPGGLTVRTFNKFVGQTVLSSALSMGLLTVTPFVVAVFAGPKQGALFSLALSIVQALDFIGAALATSLVVHASSAPEEANTMARAILIRAVALAAVGAALLIAVAPFGLRLLNSQYGAMGATGVIATLAVAAIFHCIYLVWTGLQRSRRNMKTPLIFDAVAAAVLVATMPTLCREHGALGGAWAVLLAQLALTVGITVHFLTTTRRQRWGKRDVSAGAN
jgi:O-antigen/teichoic acid export membrane protein